MKAADAVLYDFLASKELLQSVKKGAEAICVGKADGLHLLEQGRINKLLYEILNEQILLSIMHACRPLGIHDSFPYRLVYLINT